MGGGTGSIGYSGRMVFKVSEGSIPMDVSFYIFCLAFFSAWLYILMVSYGASKRTGKPFYLYFIFQVDIEKDYSVNELKKMKYAIVFIFFVFSVVSIWLTGSHYFLKYVIGKYFMLRDITVMADNSYKFHKEFNGSTNCITLLFLESLGDFSLGDYKKLLIEVGEE